MTDNFGILEELVFRIPKASKLLAAVMILGLLYSVGFLSSILYFTSVSIEPRAILFMSYLGFTLPFLLSAELFYAFLKDFPRKWAYFVACISQFLFFVYAMILTGADNFINAWHIFWIALLTLYLFNLLVLLITQGYRRLVRANLLSLFQPTLILGLFHLLLGRRIQVTAMDYMSSFVILIVGAASFLIIFLASEYFMRVNAKGLSVVELLEGLINKREKSLDLGYYSNPEVQTLGISNGDGEASICVPWVHPGPIEGFGGGQLTSKVIDNLEQNGTGFFFHVPSTHKSDLSRPEDCQKIINSMQIPEKTGKASKLISQNYENVKFYGRSFGSQKIVYMDAEYDDYEVSIFKEMIDLDDVLLVDLHNHGRRDRGKEVWYGTREAKELRESFEDFLKELNGLDQYEYNAGFSTNLEDRPVFALHEEINGEETLIFGIEGNGASKRVRKFRDELEESYDNVICFSTDTHSNIHEYKDKKQVELSVLQEAIENAQENISNAEIGFTVERSEEVKMLREDYFGLILSVNILMRLLILSLILIYLGLVFLIFF